MFARSNKNFLCRKRLQLYPTNEPTMRERERERERETETERETERDREREIEWWDGEKGNISKEPIF